MNYTTMSLEELWDAYDNLAFLSLLIEEDSELMAEFELKMDAIDKELLNRGVVINLN